MFSFFKKNKKLPREIRKIALFKEAALGDTVLISAVIKSIKEKYKNSEVIFICSHSNSLLAPNIGGDKNIILPLKNIFQSIRILRKEDFDIFIDFGSWPRINSLLTFFSGAKFSIGFNTDGQYRHYCYDHSEKHANDIHEISNYFNLIKILKVRNNHLPKLIIDENLPRFYLDSFVILHPWASGYRNELRQWPVSQWRELIEICDQKGLKVLLSGSPSESKKNKKYFKETRAENIAGKYSFQELLIIISKAKAVISVNTGVMHISAALGVATIGLSGPTNETRWGPLGENSISITPSVEGCGFLNLGFEYEGQREDCMSHIKTSQVIEALDKNKVLTY